MVSRPNRFGNVAGRQKDYVRDKRTISGIRVNRLPDQITRFRCCFGARGRVLRRRTKIMLHRLLLMCVCTMVRDEYIEFNVDSEFEKTDEKKKHDIFVSDRFRRRRRDVLLKLTYFSHLCPRSCSC